MEKIVRSDKLRNVRYEIRGPLLKEAMRLESEGFNIIKLNTGNPPAFGINAPEDVLQAAMKNIHKSQPYGDAKGLVEAREAIMQQYHGRGLTEVGLDDIYVGNGASEMIVMAMQGLLNTGDEMLVPAPDYPLWTAAVNIAGGKAVHYMCDEAADWTPDLKDIASKITARTRGIVVINPNNPTGAVYPREVLEGIVALAQKHNLIIYADEIYDQILYDDAQHIALATLVHDTLCITINGLSKSHRIPGMRVGWMVISGKKDTATDYLVEGLDVLCNMRLCGNMTAQYTVKTALEGLDKLKPLVRPGGRLYEQRNAAFEAFNSVPGISCVKARGSLYLFPKIDVKKFNITNDQKFLFDFLRAKHVLMVQGTGFNWQQPDHFRVVFLPEVDALKQVAQRMEDFLVDYRQ